MNKHNLLSFFQAIEKGLILAFFACLPFFAIGQNSVVQQDVSLKPIVYPNATNGLIKFKGLRGETLLLNVVNDQGKTVFTGEASEKEAINITHFPNGVYYFRFSDGQQSFYRNVVKK